MSNSIAPGSSADVNVRVTALTTNPNVPAQYKTIILKKNLVNGVNTLTQEMISATNTKYVIKYDYTLGEDITVPANCVLEFDGGSISGEHTITGQNTTIYDSCGAILNGIELAGTFNCILRPEWFGAKGDGINDDTNALRLTLYNSNVIAKEVNLGTKKYLISDTLNYYNGSYNDITLRIKGSSFKENSYSEQYAPSLTGGIFSESAVVVFKNATISGYMDSVKITSIRTITDNYVFLNCQLSRIDINQCIISNFGAFLADTSLGSVSYIRNSRFLSVYYFAKFIAAKSSFVDSVIENNYINGGAENKDNCCFEFGTYNGSYIRGNFIDYYRSIYSPKSHNGVDNGNINSANNHYQVFLYFYIREAGSNSNMLTLNSIGDAFNWNDPNSLEYLAQTPKIIEPGNSNVGNKTIDPYIFRIQEPFVVNIIDAIIESHISGVICTLGGCNQYKSSQFKFTCNFTGRNFELPYIDGGALADNPNYNGGSYNYKKIETNFVFTADSLPSYSFNWCKVVPGMKFLIGNILYLADVVYDEDNSQYKPQWTKISL